jgi:hypothetical protein
MHIIAFSVHVFCLIDYHLLTKNKLFISSCIPSAFSYHLSVRKLKDSAKDIHSIILYGLIFLKMLSFDDHSSIIFSFSSKRIRMQKE